MNITDIDMEELAELTLRWSRHCIKSFPRWELEELHNEAFLVAVKVMKAGRYDKEKASVNTFLWYVLPLDVRHRYRRLNGERYLTNENGFRKYRRVEIVNDKLVKKKLEQVSNYEGGLITIETETNSNSDWAKARMYGFTKREIAMRGVTYKEQRQFERDFIDEQQSKRQTW